MDENQSNLENIHPKRTPEGRGKRSRKRHCKKAIQARWQKLNLDAEGEAQSESQSGSLSVSDIQTHVLSTEGCAETSSVNCAGNENVPNSSDCTARKKLSTMKEFIDAADTGCDDREWCFMELKCMQRLIGALACESCGGSLTVSFGLKMGYSREINVACELCPFKTRQFSCARSNDSDSVTASFDVNNSMMLCFSEMGCGEAAMNKFSGIMCLPGFTHETYRRLGKKVGEAHDTVASNVLSAGVHAVRAAYGASDTCNGQGGADDADSETESEGNGDRDDSQAEGVSVSDDGDGDGGQSDDCDSDDTIVYNVNNDDDMNNDDDASGDVVDVTVSFDGTWHKRGFTSNYGVGIVIDVKTGLVVDYTVLSKYCQACTVNNSKSMSDEERLQWKRDHQPVCDKNYDGSSKGMEREAALRLWGRSIAQKKMRYTQMLSDGDSVAYKAVCDAGFYPVEKLECLNHCDKRMGTALRKKSKEARLGGGRYGSLTVNACTALQSYYRTAIVHNLGNAEKMQDAIWASFLHCSSTDENPQHNKCPTGRDSWCFYQKALAADQRPPKHKGQVGTPLSAAVAAAIKPVYDRVANINLLRKIQHGRTQNANESLNGQIWLRCPKTMHAGARKVKAAVASAVSHFNQGTSHLSQVMGTMNVTPGTNLVKYQEISDRKRCIQADAQAKIMTKRARNAKKITKKKKTQGQETREGPTYGSGMA